MPHKAILNDIERLKTVQINLPKYQHLLDTEIYSWLTPDYLNKKIHAFEAEISKQTNLESASKALCEKRRNAKKDLYRQSRVFAYVIRAAIAFFEEEEYLDDFFVSSTGINERVKKLLEGAEKHKDEIAGVDTINLQVFLDNLNSASKALLETEQELIRSKEVAQENERKLIETADQVDDLYHSVVNALEGAFHDNREVLTSICSWKKR